MTNTELLQVAGFVLEDLGVPDDCDDWSLHPQPVRPRINIYNEAVQFVVKAGGHAGEWYDTSNDGRQRNIEIEIRGIHVCGIEVEATTEGVDGV